MRRRLPLIVGVLVLLAAVACGGGSSSKAVEGAATTLEAAAQRGEFAVGVATYTLVDTSRPTEPNREYPGADSRTLPVEVWYPAEADPTQPEERDAPLDRSRAPYPLIVFAHGLSSSRLLSKSYTQHLASHGYIVAAPDFPLSHLGSPGGPRIGAVINQPEDVSFVIDSMLGFNKEAGHPLEGAIDEEHIGLTGHSLGALTTYLTTYGPKRDERIDAALPISVVGCLLGDDLVRDTSVPILFVVGTNDLLTPKAGSERAYGGANAPKYLLELSGADHIRFADVDLQDSFFLTNLPDFFQGTGSATDPAAVVDAFGGGDPSGCAGEAREQPDASISGERQRELLRAFATSFFDAYLRGSSDARAFLQKELPGLVPEASLKYEGN